jgi:transcriptional regulator with XRE-family HTH domain
MDLSKAFGIAVRKLRLSKGLTQEQLGFEADLRRTFISSLELGEKKPSLTTIYQLAKALDIPMSKLMKYVEKEIDISKK